MSTPPAISKCAEAAFPLQLAPEARGVLLHSCVKACCPLPDCERPPRTRGAADFRARRGGMVPPLPPPDSLPAAPGDVDAGSIPSAGEFGLAVAEAAALRWGLASNSNVAACPRDESLDRIFFPCRLHAPAQWLLLRRRQHPGFVDVMGRTEATMEAWRAPIASCLLGGEPAVREALEVYLRCATPANMRVTAVHEQPEAVHKCARPVHRTCVMALCTIEKLQVPQNRVCPFGSFRWSDFRVNDDSILKPQINIFAIPAGNGRFRSAVLDES